MIMSIKSERLCQWGALCLWWRAYCYLCWKFNDKIIHYCFRINCNCQLFFNFVFNCVFEFNKRRTTQYEQRGYHRPVSRMSPLYFHLQLAVISIHMSIGFNVVPCCVHLYNSRDAAGCCRVTTIAWMGREATTVLYKRLTFTQHTPVHQSVK